MEWLIVKMPVEIFEGYPEEVVNDWVIIERYIETLEIKKAEVEYQNRKEGLKALGKALFELKHPKK